MKKLLFGLIFILANYVHAQEFGLFVSCDAIAEGINNQSQFTEILESSSKIYKINSGSIQMANMNHDSEWNIILLSELVNSFSNFSKDLHKGSGWLRSVMIKKTFIQNVHKVHLKEYFHDAEIGDIKIEIDRNTKKFSLVYNRKFHKDLLRGFDLKFSGVCNNGFITYN